MITFMDVIKEAQKRNIEIHIRGHGISRDTVFDLVQYKTHTSQRCIYSRSFNNREIEAQGITEEEIYLTLIRDLRRVEFDDNPSPPA